MVKSGKGLGVLALLIAIGALSLSAYQLILPSPSGGVSVIQNVWYDEETSIYFPPTSGYVEAIPDLYIMASVNSGESLYVLFNAYASINNPSLGSFMSFKIFIDDYKLDEPHTEIHADSTLTNIFVFSVALQYSNSSLSAGTYNITCRAYSGHSGNRIYDSSLFIQTSI
jgi:hypothetical protein